MGSLFQAHAACWLVCFLACGLFFCWLWPGVCFQFPAVTSRVCRPCGLPACVLTAVRVRPASLVSLLWTQVLLLRHLRASFILIYPHHCPVSRISHMKSSCFSRFRRERYTWRCTIGKWSWNRIVFNYSKVIGMCFFKVQKTLLEIYFLTVLKLQQEQCFSF